MRYLKQSTAIDVKVGPFLDDTDQRTPETALTISQADVRLAKNDGAWAQKNESTSLTHEENGWYECKLDATDTNTLGVLVLAINEAGAMPVHIEFEVVPDEVFDALISGTGAGVRADLQAIVGETAGAARLDRSARSIVLGTVGGGSSATSIVTSALDPAHGGAVADQFKGRIVIFDRSTTTVALRGQATDITASSIAGVLTVTALTAVPASGDIFALV